MRRVVVTGLGIVSSIGTGVEEVTQSLRDARSELVDAIVETDDDLMNRYLEGEDISDEELQARLADIPPPAPLLWDGGYRRLYIDHVLQADADCLDD